MSSYSSYGKPYGSGGPPLSSYLPASSHMNSMLLGRLDYPGSTLGSSGIGGYGGRSPLFNLGGYGYNINSYNSGGMGGYGSYPSAPTSSYLGSSSGYGSSSAGKKYGSAGLPTISEHSHSSPRISRPPKFNHISSSHITPIPPIIRSTDRIPGSSGSSGLGLGSGSSGSNARSKIAVWNTEDIDVSRPRRVSRDETVAEEAVVPETENNKSVIGEENKNENETENSNDDDGNLPGTATPGEISRENQTFGTIRRGRTVIRIQTKQLKENPYLNTDGPGCGISPFLDKKPKKTAGEKMREKWAIQSKKKKYAGYQSENPDWSSSPDQPPARASRRISLSDIKKQQEALQKEIAERQAALFSRHRNRSGNDLQALEGDCQQEGRDLAALSGSASLTKSAEDTFFSNPDKVPRRKSTKKFLIMRQLSSQNLPNILTPEDSCGDPDFNLPIQVSRSNSNTNFMELSTEDDDPSGQEIVEETEEDDGAIDFWATDILRSQRSTQKMRSYFSPMGMRDWADSKEDSSGSNSIHEEDEDEEDNCDQEIVNILQNQNQLSPLLSPASKFESRRKKSGGNLEAQTNLENIEKIFAKGKLLDKNQKTLKARKEKEPGELEAKKTVKKVKGEKILKTKAEKEASPDISKKLEKSDSLDLEAETLSPKKPESTEKTEIVSPKKIVKAKVKRDDSPKSPKIPGLGDKKELVIEIPAEPKKTENPDKTEIFSPKKIVKAKVKHDESPKSPTSPGLGIKKELVIEIPAEPKLVKKVLTKNLSSPPLPASPLSLITSPLQSPKKPGVAQVFKFEMNPKSGSLSPLTISPKTKNTNQIFTPSSDIDLKGNKNFKLEFPKKPEKPKIIAKAETSKEAVVADVKTSDLQTTGNNLLQEIPPAALGKEKDLISPEKILKSESEGKIPDVKTNALLDKKTPAFKNKLLDEKTVGLKSKISDEKIPTPLKDKEKAKEPISPEKIPKSESESKIPDVKNIELLDKKAPALKNNILDEKTVGLKSKIGEEKFPAPLKTKDKVLLSKTPSTDLNLRTKNLITQSGIEFKAVGPVSAALEKSKAQAPSTPATTAAEETKLRTDTESPKLTKPKKALLTSPKTAVINEKKPEEETKQQKINEPNSTVDAAKKKVAEAKAGTIIPALISSTETSKDKQQPPLEKPKAKTPWKKPEVAPAQLSPTAAPAPPLPGIASKIGVGIGNFGSPTSTPPRTPPPGPGKQGLLPSAINSKLPQTKQEKTETGITGAGPPPDVSSSTIAKPTAINFKNKTNSSSIESNNSSSGSSTSSGFVSGGSAISSPVTVGKELPDKTDISGKSTKNIFGLQNRVKSKEEKRKTAHTEQLVQVKTSAVFVDDNVTRTEEISTTETSSLEKEEKQLGTELIQTQKTVSTTSLSSVVTTKTCDKDKVDPVNLAENRVESDMKIEKNEVKIETVASNFTSVTTTSTTSNTSASFTAATDTSTVEEKEEKFEESNKSLAVLPNPVIQELIRESKSRCSSEGSSGSVDGDSPPLTPKSSGREGSISTTSSSTLSAGTSSSSSRRMPSPPASDESDEDQETIERRICPTKTRPKYRKYEVEDFQFLKVLGKGSFGKVLLAELKGTDCYFAIKCLKKDVVLEDDDVECTMIERKVLLMGSKHPYLCHLLCTFQTESHLFFVMEYLNGGDLMFHIQQTGRFTEDRARFYAAEIVSGLKFLHKKGIIYRDLKLDNILLDFEGHIRIADFGMCKLQIYLDRTADTFCGTPDYMAPEIIKGQKYNQCVDWWAFGILLYEMLIGQSPFSGCDEDELFWSVCNEAVRYPRFLSRNAKTILEMLLEKDASKRLGSSTSGHGEVKEIPFFAAINWDKLERRELEPPYKPKLKHSLDVQYFDTTFTKEMARLTPVDKQILRSMDQTQFEGFSYTNPHTTD